VYVSVCIRVCVYTGLCVRVCVKTSICIRFWVHTSLCAFVSVWKCVYAYTSLALCVYVSVCIRLCVYTCLFAYRTVRIQLCVYVSACTGTCVCSSLRVFVAVGFCFCVFPVRWLPLISAKQIVTRIINKKNICQTFLNNSKRSRTKRGFSWNLFGSSNIRPKRFQQKQYLEVLVFINLFQSCNFTTQPNSCDTVVTAFVSKLDQSGAWITYFINALQFWCRTQTYSFGGSRLALWKTRCSNHLKYQFNLSSQFHLTLYNPPVQCGSIRGCKAFARACFSSKAVLYSFSVSDSAVLETQGLEVSRGDYVQVPAYYASHPPRNGYITYITNDGRALVKFTEACPDHFDKLSHIMCTVCCIFVCIVCVSVLWVSCVCFLYILYILCMFCVCLVYVLCMFCVCFVCILCVYCICSGCVLCLYWVCFMCVLCFCLFFMTFCSCISVILGFMCLFLRVCMCVCERACVVFDLCVFVFIFVSVFVYFLTMFMHPWPDLFLSVLLGLANTC